MHHAGPIGSELSCQDYGSIFPKHKPYVLRKGEGKHSAFLKDTDSNAYEKEVEDMDYDEINELVRQILEIEEFIPTVKKPKSGLVSILKVPSKNADKRPTHGRRVRFALN